MTRLLAALVDHPAYAHLTSNSEVCLRLEPGILQCDVLKVLLRDLVGPVLMIGVI